MKLNFLYNQTHSNYFYSDDLLTLRKFCLFFSDIINLENLLFND